MSKLYIVTHNNFLISSVYIMIEITNCSVDNSSQPKINNILENRKKNILVLCDFTNNKEASQGTDAIADYLEAMDIYRKKNVCYYKMMYNIFIELIENIAKHNEITQDQKAELIVSKQENKYILELISFCREIDFDRLSNVLILNELTLEEIGQLYSDQLLYGEISEKGGAGMGNYTIARRIKSFFPDKKNIFSLKRIIAINDLVKSHLKIEIPFPNGIK